MPNETLIASLQTLQNEYSKKQKATNNLVKTLKGKSSAFGKIQAALWEYTANKASRDGESAGHVQEIFSDAGESINPLLSEAAREAKALAKLTTALKGVLAALSSSPVDVVRLSHPYENIKATELQDERIQAILPEIEHELEEAQNALGVLFGAALRDALAGQGFSVRGTTPKFEVGRFEIAANFLTRTATVNYGKEVVIKRVPLSVEAVVKAYQNAVKSITGRNENPETWLAQFYSAWEAARRKSDPSNPRANVVACYFELVMQRQTRTFFSAPTKGLFVDYTRAQFAYDLQEIAIRPHRNFKGKFVFAHSAIKTQSDSATKSLWVVEGSAPHDGRYIGDIVFDKDE